MDGRGTLTAGVCLVCAVLASTARAQESQGQAAEWARAGQLFMRQFGTEDYRADRQNWAIVQDARGLLYVGNNYGVLEYDGFTWRLIRLANGAIARSLDVDATGRIYVGGYAEIGYLAPDDRGLMSYHSLIDRLTEEERDFTDVWTTYVQPDGVYFQSSERVIRIADDAVMSWVGSGLEWAHRAHGNLYFQRSGHAGLYVVSGDSLTMVPGSESISSRAMLVEGRGATFWVLAEQTGIMRCTVDPLTCEAVERTSTPLVRDHWVYAADVLPDGGWVLGLYNAGLVITDADGNVLRHVRQEDGLFSDFMTAVKVDREGNIWAAQEKGLSHLIADPRWSFFDGRNGLVEPPEEVMLHEGTLYAVNVSGVHRLTPGSTGLPASFVALGGDARECGALVVTRNGLLAGCEGLYRVRGGDMEEVTPDSLVGKRFYDLRRLSSDSTRVIAGFSGVSVLREYQDGRIQGAPLKDYGEFSTELVESPQGVWMTNEIALIEMHWPAGMDAPPETMRYGIEAGLPRVPVFPIWMNDGIYAISTEGLFRGVYDQHRTDVVRHFEPVDVRGAPGPIQDVTPRSAGGYWALSNGILGMLHLDEAGVWAWEEVHRVWADRMPGLVGESDQALWVNLGQRYIRYVPHAEVSDTLPPPVFRAMLNVSQDTLVIAGQTEKLVTLPFSRDEYRFSYASGRFAQAEAVRYRTWLENHDTQWSTWTEEHHRDFTNLPEGRYVFRVQMRSPTGQISTETALAFRILPPWYRTPWANVLWVILLAAGVAGVAVGYNHLRSRRLEQRTLSLEHAIKERTEEITRQKHFVEHQNRKLAEVNAELARQQVSIGTAYHQLQMANEALNRSHQNLEERTVELRDALEQNKEILGITAHDLKNPLGGIIGLAEMLLEDSEAGPEQAQQSVQEMVPLVRDEARRMLQIITDLLDRQRHGERQALTLQQVAVAEPITAVLRWNARRADQKGITLHMSAPGLIRAQLDVPLLQRVVDNLVSNAIKYSAAGSNVWVLVERISSPAGEDGPAHVRISVRDEGPGLTREDLQRVFGKLERLSARPTGGEHSSGLGLYIVKRLVEAHGGEVGVESTPGQGATFWVNIPDTAETAAALESE